MIVVLTNLLTFILSKTQVTIEIDRSSSQSNWITRKRWNNWFNEFRRFKFQSWKKITKENSRTSSWPRSRTQRHEDQNGKIEKKSSKRLRCEKTPQSQPLDQILGRLSSRKQSKIPSSSQWNGWSCEWTIQVVVWTWKECFQEPSKTLIRFRPLKLWWIQKHRLLFWMLYQHFDLFL